MHRDDHRRSIYLVVVAILTPMVVSVWSLRQAHDPFMRYTYPFVALYLVWVLWRLLAHPAHLASVERLTFWVVTALSLGGVAARLYQNPDVEAAWGAIAAFPLPLLLLCVVLAQLVFDTRRALVIGAGLVAATTLLGLGRILPEVLDGASRQVLVGFLWHQTIQSVTLVFLYVVARIKDDVRDARTETERMRTMAYEDALTRLPNRRELELELTRQLSRSERSGRPFCLVLCDLDGFKALNDGHGHATGDAVLHEFGAMLPDAVRAGDVSGRWGGEEFLVLAPDTDLAAGVALAERIRGAIEAHAFPAGLSVTASLGVAEWEPGSSRSSLLREADRRLYEAKDAGRNAVRPALREADRPVAADAGPRAAGAAGDGGTVPEIRRP